MVNRSAPKIRKIVLTGGPCAGKTTIADVLRQSFSDRMVVVPETASALLRGGFPRWEEASAVCAFQTAVYSVQLQIEAAYEKHHDAAILVLDRGSADGGAYWPDGPEAFFRTMGTTHEAEMSRYDRVIYLESADSSDYDAHQAENPARNEDWKKAKAIDTKTLEVWRKHPRITVVKAQASFVDKVLSVLKLVAEELGESATHHIQLE